MSRAQLVRLVDQKLQDPSFIRACGPVSRDCLDSVRRGLLDLPEAALRQFLESRAQIVLGSDRDFEDLFRRNGESWASPFGQNIRAENARMFGGRPTVIIRSDITDQQVRYVCRHEIGHALDHMNAGYSGYASVKSENFRRAVNDYMARKRDAPDTLPAFEGDGSFRKLIQRYGVRDGNINESLYKEMAAELFNKYCALEARSGPRQADNFMARNYLDAWKVYKAEIMPAIGAAIDQAAPRQAGRQMAFDPAAEENLQSQSWKKTVTVQGLAIIRISIDNIPEAVVRDMERALRNNGIDPIRKRSSTMGQTLRIVGDDVAKFESIRASGVRFTPLSPANVALARNAERLLHSSRWQEATTTTNAPIIRLPIGDIPEDQVREVERLLQLSGIMFERRHSNTLGETLRISGESLRKFREMRELNLKFSDDRAPATRMAAPQDESLSSRFTSWHKGPNPTVLLTPGSVTPGVSSSGGSVDPAARPS